jgi:hypothetical protein
MDRSTARCFQAGSSLALVTGGSDDCRKGRTSLECTGERRDIGVLDPLADHVSETVTFLLREYYSLARVYGSAMTRAGRAVRENVESLIRSWPANR